jgi:hypothetical protein
MLQSRKILVVAASLIVGVALLGYLVGAETPADVAGPLHYTDDDFWRLVEDLSEEEGFFRSDNFVSNEVPYQHVIPELQRLVGTGGVYLGVGPDQNYTYIAATRPELAFIVDIRRQNMLQHLLYKAIFELSVDRVEFLSLLFSRPVPPGLDRSSDIDQIMLQFRTSEGHPELFAANLDDVLDRLERHHLFDLAPADLASIEYVYEAFYREGPNLRYSARSRRGWRQFPTYADLVVQGDVTGTNHNYLASEESFRFIKGLHAQNRIIPLVGDFAGQKSLASLGDYLRARDLTVSTFYTSNVEYYLFQSEGWRRFFRNVARLPMNSNSTFVRSYFNNYGYRHPAQQSRHFSVTLLDSIPNVVAEFQQGGVRNYYALIQRSH